MTTRNTTRQELHSTELFNPAFIHPNATYIAKKPGQNRGAPFLCASENTLLACVPLVESTSSTFWRGLSTSVVRTKPNPRRLVPLPFSPPGWQSTEKVWVCWLQLPRTRGESHR